MVWLIALVAFFIGTSVVESNTMVGLALMAPLAGMLLMRFRPRPKEQSRTRPTAHMEAKLGAQQAIAAAERRAAKHVAEARRKAEAEGREAIRRAQAMLDAEPKWIQ